MKRAGAPWGWGYQRGGRGGGWEPEKSCRLHGGAKDAPGATPAPPPASSLVPGFPPVPAEKAALSAGQPPTPRRKNGWGWVAQRPVPQTGPPSPRQKRVVPDELKGDTFKAGFQDKTGLGHPASCLLWVKEGEETAPRLGLGEGSTPLSSSSADGHGGDCSRG